jgi:hypothetical protein
MSYLWLPGLPIHVWLHQGLPYRFQWENQSFWVAHIVDSWRVDTGWWRLERRCCHYWQLATTTRVLMVIYQDEQIAEPEHAWFLEQLVD